MYFPLYITIMCTNEFLCFSVISPNIWLNHDLQFDLRSTLQDLVNVPPVYIISMRRLFT